MLKGVGFSLRFRVWGLGCRVSGPGDRGLMQTTTEMGVSENRGP